MIQWLPQLSDISGLAIRSPVTGLIMPLHDHYDPLYSNNILPLALCIKLENGTVYAPFNCEYSYCLMSGRRLRFKHQSGLILQIDLPGISDAVNDNSIVHLTSGNIRVSAGQAVVKLDLQQLVGNNCNYAVLMILPHPIIASVSSSERFVDAVSDTAITIQLKSK